jgi:Tetratricopeptide repeat
VPRPWLFGPNIDLLFGCGIGYVLITGILSILKPPMDRVQGWLPFVILFTGLPHYGATLERVYSTPEARRHYGRYALGFGILIGIAFLFTVISGRGGSALVTLYLTWSPWHYAAQNFGLVMMFLRRAQVQINPRFRLAIRTSFVLSFLLVFVNIHRGSAAAASDPLYAVPSARDAVRFVPLGLAENMTPLLLVVLGVAYALVTIGVVVTMIRRTPAGMGAPALSLIFSQWAWFVMPVVLSQFVPWWFAPGGPTALAFSWVAIAHSVQYLWISLHFARMSGRTSLFFGSLARYYGLAIFAGATIWVFPVLFSVKGGLTRMPHESGLDMLVAAAVNLHHFLLDGVIWKLRDAPVRRALVDGHSDVSASSSESSSESRKLPWGRIIVSAAGIIAVVCWVIAAWEQEVGRRWSVARGDLGRLELAQRRLAWVGRDGPRIHQAMAKLLQNQGDDSHALKEYQRSIELWPTSGAWLGLGKIHENAGRLAEAQAAYENAVAIEPNHASGLDDLAHVLANRGHVELAVKIQRRALEAAPDRRDLRRRYDALLVRLPINADDAEEVVIDVYDGGIPEAGP